MVSVTLSCTYRGLRSRRTPVSSGTRWKGAVGLFGGGGTSFPVVETLRGRIVSCDRCGANPTRLWLMAEEGGGRELPPSIKLAFPVIGAGSRARSGDPIGYGPISGGARSECDLIYPSP